MLEKAIQKDMTLTGMASYMDQKRKRIIMKAYMNSQFGYCSLVWMMRSRTINKKVNKIHERSLRIVYQDDTPTFEK